MTQQKIIVTNREVSRDYYLEKHYEAGIVLKGGEVKSLRNGKSNLKGSFAKVNDGELFLHNMHISPYEYAHEDYNPVRTRKLLLRKAEIKHLDSAITQQGYTLVPLKVYFKQGRAKVEIALAKGKKLYDKRRSLKEKEAKREISRALRHKNK